jgi:hypothetical protein
MSQKYRHYTTAKFYKSSHKFLLGLYAACNFLIYPLLVASVIFFPIWWLPLAVYGLKLMVQSWILYRTMHKLNEADLFPWFLLFDVWFFFYYIFTLPAIWKKPEKNWA